MNTKKCIRTTLLTIGLSIFAQLSFAQKAVVADSIDAEEAFGKKQVPQVFLQLLQNHSLVAFQHAVPLPF